MSVVAQSSIVYKQDMINSNIIYQQDIVNSSSGVEMLIFVALKYAARMNTYFACESSTSYEELCRPRI